MMRRLLGFALTVAFAAGACKAVREELPTQSQSPEEVAGVPLIPVPPTPSPVPTDAPPLPAEGDDDEASEGGRAGEDISGTCNDPVPPQISRVNVKVLSTRPSRVILDATPLVGPNGDYCAQIGYTDGRSFCAVRPPGHPERAACEALRVGSASDTGRVGPTWSAGGQGCRGEAGSTSCENHPDNQYLVFAWGSGRVRACVAGGTCGQVVLP